MEVHNYTMANLVLSEDTFGILLPYIKEKTITDIRWDGNNLWLDDLEKGRILTDIKLEEPFINKFTSRLSDLANTNFNSSSPVLEAETDSLRIACLHPSVTNTGIAITIRKTEAECRLKDDQMIETGYCSEEMLDFLKQAVKARCSFVVTGDVGSGKTELVKKLMQSIPDTATTLTVEDNYELRAKALRPHFDCTEIKVTKNFPPKAAIKAALRQNTKWLMLSEARSTEAIELLEAASTGCSIATTVHAWDVRNIPDRFENMIGNTNNDVKNDVCSYFDIGILIVKKEGPDGIRRYIDQLCFYEHTEDGNNCYMILDEGRMVGNHLTDKIRERFRRADMKIPELFVGDANV